MKAKIIILSFLVFALLLMGVYVLAAVPNPGHPAGDIGSGIFGSNRTGQGNYIFPNSSNVGIGRNPQQRLDVAGNIRYSGKLTKLDVANNFTATVRAADFSFGYSNRRGNPGRALVDYKNGSRHYLYLNYSADWANGTIVGSNLGVGGSVNANLYYDRDDTDYFTDPASTSVLRHLRVGEDGGWTALYLYGKDRWLLNAHNGGNLNVRHWNGANWNQHVLSLTPAGNARFQGHLYAGDEIKSLNKSQFKNIHIDRLTEKHEKCTHSVLYNQTNLLFCNAACSRYCQDQNYSGGTVSEYNNDTHYAGCICIP